MLLGVNVRTHYPVTRLKTGALPGVLSLYAPDYFGIMQIPWYFPAIRFSCPRCRFLFPNFCPSSYIPSVFMYTIEYIYV